jgi:hypothetical protein
VTCKLRQHVIEERDTGVDLVLTGAIEVQADTDIRLFGLAAFRHRSGFRHRVSSARSEQPGIDCSPQACRPKCEARAPSSDTNSRRDKNALFVERLEEVSRIVFGSHEEEICARVENSMPGLFCNSAITLCLSPISVWIAVFMISGRSNTNSAAVRVKTLTL